MTKSLDVVTKVRVTRMNKKIVLLSGPANSGKGDLCKYLQMVLAETCSPFSMEVISCKDKLYKLVQEMFCVSPSRFWEIYNDRTLKEVPLPEFNVHLTSEDCCRLMNALGYNVWTDDKERNRNVITGDLWLSVREAMIYLSECIMKPRMGTDYFGKARVASVLTSPHHLILDDSASAFEVNGEVRADEIYPLIKAVGQENILLLRIHREVCSFDNDSRRYVPDGVVDNTVDVYNEEGKIQDYLIKATDIILDFARG